MDNFQRPDHTPQLQIPDSPNTHSHHSNLEYPHLLAAGPRIQREDRNQEIKGSLIYFIIHCHENHYDLCAMHS
jgi:hypothetical protein